MNPRSRFPALDGLRGVAAAGVLWLHGALIFIGPDFAGAASAYLAVDFFFMLSGFVLAFAYGERLNRGMRWSDFALLRLIRLYPMIVVGVLLGALVAAIKLVLTGQVEPGQSLWWVGPALLMLPTGLAVGAQAFPFNNPVWSLFFELLINGVYATRVRRLPVGALVAILAVSTLFLACAAAYWGSFLLIGFNDVPKFLAGTFRVTTPFFIGVLIYDLRLYERFPALPFPALAAVLAVALWLHSDPAWLYDLGATLLLFPVLVAAGAAARPSPFWTRICDLSGALSYPLYLLHLPLLHMTAFVVKAVRPQASGELLWAVSSAAAVIGAWIVLKLYDEPVRAWLGRMRTARPPTIAP